jgi:adenosylcobinamide kinase/adenosylcobinamide-phosphate guanylyltransferase
MTEEKLILITGGARSGKSSFAIELASGLSENVLYVATAEASDPEMEARIIHHRNKRPSNWETVEIWEDPETVFENHREAEVVILDCLTLLVNNLLPTWSEPGETWDDSNELEKIEKRVMEKFDQVLSAVEKNGKTVILVTNEVGLGIVPPYPLGRFYRDFMGVLNQRAAAAADEVYFMVSGIPVRVK